VLAGAKITKATVAKTGVSLEIEVSGKDRKDRG
jgi:hypothetical protein